jgi:hypothetical protein
MVCDSGGLGMFGRIELRGNHEFTEKAEERKANLPRKHKGVSNSFLKNGK